LEISYDYAINKKNGDVLQAKIDDFRMYVDTIFSGNASKISVYNKIFSTAKDPKKLNKNNGHLSWIEKLFSDVPVSAAITLLTKYQNDIRSAEMDMIQYLMGQTDKEDVRVNKIKAFVIPTSKNVFLGGKYHAEIVLAAVDSTSTPTVNVIGRGELPVSGTTGIYDVVTSKLGLQKFTGYITRPEDVDRKYEFNGEYIVSEPSATVSNTDLDVVFLGMDNNFEASVPGIASDNVSITVTGGGSTFAKKGSGKYTIKPTQLGEVTVSVIGKVEGKDMAMGGRKFKVKRLPRPSIYVLDKAGNERENRMPMNDLRGAKLVASYGPDAVISAKFTITSFTMVIEGLASKNVVGEKLDEAYLNKLTRGKSIIISNIKATGPGGEQTLSATAITAM
jgi:gliding motility-associated protein GldM